MIGLFLNSIGKYQGIEIIFQKLNNVKGQPPAVRAALFFVEVFNRVWGQASIDAKNQPDKIYIR
ncbi:MAG: hypothetical protein ACYC4H_03290, partial [Desulfocucumaceae bacterium]